MKQKDLLIILIPTFILTVLWVIFSIYHNYTTSTITDPLTIQVVPIAGSFDTNAISKIKDRQLINPLYQSQNQGAVTSPTPTPATPTPTVENGPSVTPTESITPTPIISPEPSVTGTPL